MINIKVFGDVHANECFSYDKLSRIENVICDGKTNYIMFTGDLVDTNDFIRTDRIKRDILLKWIERLSSNSRFIMVPGNHDIFSKRSNKWIFDIDESFWKELASIEGVSFIPTCEKYEDESIYVTGVDLGYDYYEKYQTHEDKEELLKRLKSIREKLLSTDRNKLNVFLSHSPVYMTDKGVLLLIEGFDLVLSGHMHNGGVLPFMAPFLPKNRGIISPKGRKFPNNARGTIDLNDNGSKLVITGGISKIVENSSITRKLNGMFPMEITEVEYNSENKESIVKSLYL